MTTEKTRKPATKRPGDRTAVRVRFYPTKRQAMYIDRNIRACSFVYNYFLRLNIKHYRTHKKFLWKKDMTPILKEMKNKPQYKWLSKVPAIALIHSIDALDRAFRNRFSKDRKGGPAGFPKFKGKKNRANSFTISGHIDYNEETTEFRFAGVSPSVLSKSQNVRTLVEIVWPKGINGLPSFPTQYTVTREPSGRYFISFLCPVFNTPLKPVVRSVGVDLGIKSLLVSSEGETFDNEKYFYNFQRKLRIEQRKLQRKRDAAEKLYNGKHYMGKNYQKQRKIVAKLHAKVLDKRKCRWHNISKQLINDNQIICIENLNIRGMLFNKKLSKSISDAGWGIFTNQLKYKAKAAGREIVIVDRFYPSSQMCSSCGLKNPAVKNLTVREWTCPECGSHHDRDVNAAINIKKEGLRIRQENS